MCGIGGYICKRPFNVVDKEEIMLMCEELEVYGDDAFGFYNGFTVFRAPVRASVLWNIVRELGDLNKVFPEGCRLFLFHCRRATHGSPRNNANNHPFERKNFIVAHNGVIYNYREIFDPDVCKVECDSFAIIKLLEDNYHGDCEEALKSLGLLKGTVSTWIYCKPERRLFIYTNQSNLGYQKVDDCFLFYTTNNFKYVKEFKKRMVYELDLDALELRELFEVEIERAFDRGPSATGRSLGLLGDYMCSYYDSDYDHYEASDEAKEDVLLFLDLNDFGYVVKGDLIKLTRIPKRYKDRLSKDTYYTFEELHQLLYDEIRDLLGL